METAGVRHLRPLVLLFCALILSEASYPQPSTAFSSNSTHQTLIRFGSLTGGVSSERYSGTIALGQSTIVSSATSSSLRSETGLLAMLLLLSPSDGDINRDGRVDALDLFVLHKWWQRVLPGEGLPAEVDLTPDGEVNHLDLLEFIRLSHQFKQRHKALGLNLSQKHILDLEYPGGIER